MYVEQVCNNLLILGDFYVVVVLFELMCVFIGIFLFGILLGEWQVIYDGVCDLVVLFSMMLQDLNDEVDEM